MNFGSIAAPVQTMLAWHNELKKTRSEAMGMRTTRALTYSYLPKCPLYWTPAVRCLSSLPKINVLGAAYRRCACGAPRCGANYHRISAREERNEPGIKEVCDAGISCSRTTFPDLTMADRIEHDSFGEIRVPADRLWGTQTQRSLENFRISGERMPMELIRALALVKRSCARVNVELKELPEDKAKAIAAAADEVLAGKHDGEFPLVVWQTGSGTQTNMNMNEVLANRASELLGGERGEKRLVHPNDDVNKGQSSNDVFPTAMHVAAVPAILDHLIPSVRLLRDTLARKGEEFRDI